MMRKGSSSKWNCSLLICCEDLLFFQTMFNHTDNDVVETCVIFLGNAIDLLDQFLRKIERLIASLNFTLGFLWNKRYVPPPFCNSIL